MEQFEGEVLTATPAKTWKREMGLFLAVCLLALCGYLAVYKTAEEVGAYSFLVQALTMPVILFNALAFGLDWTGKQGSDLFSGRMFSAPTDRPPYA